MTGIIVYLAFIWLACLACLAIMCQTAPRGREIPGVGFVRDVDDVRDGKR